MSPRFPLDPWMASWQSLRLAEPIRTLRLGCTIVPRTEPTHWYRLVDDPKRTTVVDLELHLGLELVRAQYNAGCLATVGRTRRTHLGRRAGFCDLWVPLQGRGRVDGVLAFGPFLAERPTLDSLREAWGALAGAVSDPEDPAFLRYVACAVETHVYEGPALASLTDFLERIAAVMAGSAPRVAYAEHLAVWRRVLGRVPEARMWEIAGDLVDSERHVIWTAGLRSGDLLEEGILSMPSHVVVAAPLDRGPSALGTAALMLRTDRLQRACAALCAEIGGVLAGRVGHDAVCFLVQPNARRDDRLRAKLAAFADRVIRFARRSLGVELACGVGRRARSGAELAVRHDEALWAALWGLHRGEAVTFYEEAAGPGDARSPVALYRSSRSLCESFSLGQGGPSMVSAQQIIKDVLWTTGGSLEAMRSHFLEVAWELLAIAERRYGIDERDSADTLSGITSRLQLARTAQQMTTTFTTIVQELLTAALRPGVLGRRAKLERARRLVEEAGRGQAVDLVSVAKRVGLSPGHFSRCFRSAYGMGFGAFVLRSRLQRGHRLLRETKLRIGDVALEAGFSSASYFVQAFRRATGMTPTAYRALGATTRRVR